MWVIIIFNERHQGKIEARANIISSKVAKLQFVTDYFILIFQLVGHSKKSGFMK